jgi:uncharacterized protein YidB (DUF937 family)
MSIFDSLVQTALQSALGGNAESQTQNVVKSVVGMLTNSSGGISGLVDKFKQSGLGDVAASWISTGENKPVSPQQLEAALGADKVAELAKEAGIPVDKGAEVLSQVLPAIVDKMTPEGAIPEEHKLGTLSKIILGGLGVAGATMAAKAVASRFGNKDETGEAVKTDESAGNVAPGAAPTSGAQAKTYTVVPGDTLSKIAKQYYGNANDWPKIFDANKDKLSNPDRISIGQVLRIP